MESRERRSSWLGQSLLNTLLIVLVTGLLVACGGSDGSNGAPGGGSDSAAASVDGSEGASDGGAAPDAPGGDAAAQSFSGSEPETCAALVAIFVSTGPVSEIPLSQWEQVLGQLGVQGPSEIRDDLRLFSEVMEPWFDLLQDLGVNTPAETESLSQEDRQRLETLTTSLTATAEVSAAQENIEAYIDREC